MALLRWLVLILVVALVVRWALRVLRPPAPPAKPEDFQKLTRCEVCGTHILPPAPGVRPVCERCRTR